VRGMDRQVTAKGTAEANPDEAIRKAVARAKEGDRDAVRYLYVLYADAICAYVVGIVHDEHEAEDITHQVFVKLMTAIRRYEPRGVPFSAWLHRIARNAAIDHLRARRPIPTEEVESGDAPSVERGVERTHSMRDALESLPAEQRNVLMLRHLVGLSPREIAVRMGRSESAVHGLHHRGRRAMREQLVAMDAGPAALGGRRREAC
jgi:RNA polymerase sigma-70 factor, ECF subfamily